MSTPTNTQRINRCPGCFPRFQENQMGHMGPWGCLGEDSSQDSFDLESEEDEPSVILNLEQLLDQVDQVEVEEEQEQQEQKKEKIDISKPLVQPLFALPTNFQFPECAICFEQIDMVNVTVTTCGHSFHSSCMFKALENNDCCPMCRHQLLEEDDEDADEISLDDDDEIEDGDDEDDDDDATSNASDDEEVKVNLEQLTDKIQNMGYTMSDVLKFFISSVKSETNEQKYSEEYLNKIAKDLDGVLDGTITLAHRDSRSYAAVAAAAKPESIMQQQQA